MTDNNPTAAQPLDLDKPLTGEDLMRLVFQRPDVSPAGREAEISYVMRGRGELTLAGGDFDTMAEHVNALIAHARAAQPESATLASQEDITGTTGASVKTWRERMDEQHARTAPHCGDKESAMLDEIADLRAALSSRPAGEVEEHPKTSKNVQTAEVELPPLPLGIGSGEYIHRDDVRAYGQKCARAALASKPAAREAAEQQSIDTPEFYELLKKCYEVVEGGGMSEALDYFEDQLIAHIDAWRVPAGYKLAPIRSTAEMNILGRRALRNCGNDQASIHDAELCWSAMIDAAPDKEPPCGS